MDEGKAASLRQQKELLWMSLNALRRTGTANPHYNDKAGKLVNEIADIDERLALWEADVKATAEARRIF